jgi:hypothetical protein
MCVVGQTMRTTACRMSFSVIRANASTVVDYAMAARIAATPPTNITARRRRLPLSLDHRHHHRVNVSYFLVVRRAVRAAALGGSRRWRRSAARGACVRWRVYGAGAGPRRRLGVAT